MKPLRLLADADTNDKLVRALRHREPAIDFLSATDGGTRGIADKDVLALAAATGRVVVSSDASTMPPHFTKFIETHDSPGLVIVPQSLPMGRAIEGLLRVWSEMSANELRNRIRWLPRH